MKRVDDIKNAKSYKMSKIVKYLEIWEVLDDLKEVHKLWEQVARYSVINDQLYKQLFEGDPI